MPSADKYYLFFCLNDLFSNRKKSLFAFAFVFFLFTQGLKAQFPNPSDFNTATNLTNTGVLAPGANDLHWTAAITNSLGPYLPAQVCGNVASYPGGWVNSPYPNCDWIAYPYGCTGGYAIQTCSQNPASGVDIFYKLTFNLPSTSCGLAVTSPSAYCISLDFFADNCVYAIYVNNVQNYLNPTPSPYFAGGFASGANVSVSLCNNWQAGSNSVIVHVKSGYYTGPANYEGFLAQANQTINPGMGIPVSATSTQSNPVCFGGTGSTTVTANGGTPPYTYSWIPAGGTSSVATGLSAGNYSCVVSSGTACSYTQAVTISQPPALNLNISASSTSACIGNSVSLSASASGGTPGYSYTWTAGPATHSCQVAETIAGTYTYIATASDLSNCSATNSILIDFFNTPAINVPSLSICPGSTGTLVASGAATYTWHPSGSSGSTYTAAPVTETSYTVTGTSTTGCLSTSTTTISIKPAPSLSFTTAAINCANLGSATVSASGGGSGPYSYTWSPSMQTSPVATGLIPGDHTLFVSDNGTGCIHTATTNFAPLVPLTGTVSSSAGLTCHAVNNGTAHIALSGGSGTESYLWTDALGTQTTTLASGLSSGISTVTVVDALTYCTVTHTFLITQPPALTLHIAANSPSVCLGGNLSFTASASGGTPGYSYTWTNAGTGATQQANEVLAGSYVYTAVATDANTCTITQTISGTFVNNPTVTVQSISVCPNASTVLVATGAVVYQWNTGNSGSSLLLTAGSSTVYNVTGSTSGCSASATASVTLKPVPTATFTSNASSFCPGQSLQLNGLGTTLSYAWNGPLSYTSASQQTSVNSLTPAHSGNYTLTVTAANGCTASLSKSFTVHPTPLLSVVATTVCENQTLQFTANSSTGGSYAWNGPASFTSGQQNPMISSVVPAMSGGYSLTLTSPAGCTVMAIADASVIATPTPVILAGSQYCSGSNIALAGSGGDSYHWYGPQGYITSVQNPTMASVTPLASGIYSLYAYVAGCSGLGSQSITINPLPVITASNNGPVCEKTNLFLSGVGNSPAYTYTWTGPLSYSVASATGVVPNISLFHAGQYTLSATDNNNCTGHAVTSVSILPAPVVTAGHATVCLGGTVALSASGGTAYAWLGPSGQTSALSSLYIPTVVVSDAGVYTVQVNGTTACQSSATVQLFVFPYALPVPSVAYSGPTCLNTELALYGSGGQSYLWTGPGSFSATTKEIHVPAGSTAMSGIYTLSVRNASNCAASATVAVNILPLPAADLKISHTGLCAPFCSTVQLKQASGSTGIVSATYGMEGHFIKDSLMSALKYCFSKPGTYVLVASFKDTNHCVSTSTLNIQAYPRPQADFDFKPLHPLAGIDEVQFYNTSQNSTAWSWFLEGAGSSQVDARHPAFLYEQAGIYPLVLVARNAYGCSDTVMKNIEVRDELVIYVPDAFTPNGDGINDTFYPKGAGIFGYSLEIYNRWGERIFASNDISRGWDGTFKGKECKTDSYTWKIQLTGSSGQSKQLLGQVSLIRYLIKEEQ